MAVCVYFESDGSISLINPDSQPCEHQLLSLSEIEQLQELGIANTPIDDPSISFLLSSIFQVLTLAFMYRTIQNQILNRRD
jgi:hypothetical protein